MENNKNMKFRNTISRKLVEFLDDECEALEEQVNFLIDEISSDFSEQLDELSEKAETYERMLNFCLVQTELIKVNSDRFDKYGIDKLSEEMKDLINETLQEYANVEEDEIKPFCNYCGQEVEVLDLDDEEMECNLKVLFLDDISDLKDINKLIEKIQKKSGGTN